MNRHLSRKERGLGKHDAPLKIQFMKGYDGFIYGKIRNPYGSDTMLYREWERGFNKAYYECLKKRKRYEQATERSTTMGGEQIQPV